MSGFYRGCVTNLLRTTPAAAVTFTSFELINRQLKIWAETPTPPPKQQQDQREQQQQRGKQAAAAAGAAPGAGGGGGGAVGQIAVSPPPAVAAAALFAAASAAAPAGLGSPRGDPRKLETHTHSLDDAAAEEQR